MKKMKFVDIYDTLLNRILSKEYDFDTLLPTEAELTKEFNVARNTIRRAIALLQSKGFVHVVRGRGATVIHKSISQSIFKYGEIESFAETTKRLHKRYNTEVISFETEVVTQSLSELTNFPIGRLVYHIVRVRYFDNTPVIIDESYFLKSIAKNLTKQIAKTSIYSYLEDKLDVKIQYSKRNIKVLRATNRDMSLLPNLNYDCLIAVSNYCYDSFGNLFEYSVSKHHPVYFSFEEIAVRNKDISNEEIIEKD